MFLHALHSVSNPIEAHIIGNGTELASVENAALVSAIPLTYHGVKPMAAIPEFMAVTDILVQPSITRDDGWAAVVSEALSAGAAVVATECVGASICLDDDTRGRVVYGLSAKKVAEAIDWLVENGRLTPGYRSRRSAWAKAHLTGAVGADYLLKIFEHIYGEGRYPRPFYLD